MTAFTDSMCPSHADQELMEIYGASYAGSGSWVTHREPEPKWDIHGWEGTGVARGGALGLTPSFSTAPLAMMASNMVRSVGAHQPQGDAQQVQDLEQLQREYRHMELNRRAYAEESQQLLRKQQVQQK